MPYQPEQWDSDLEDSYDWGYKKGYPDSKNGYSSNPPYKIRGQLVVQNKEAAAYYGYLDGYQDEEDGLDLPDHFDDGDDKDEDDDDC